MVAVVKGLNRPSVTEAAALLPPSRRLVDPDELLQARRLHASQYVTTGYLAAEAIDADGTVSPEADPWVPYSRHFGAFDAGGHVRATARVIGNEAPWSLPTLELPGLDPSARKRLGDVPAGQLGEISALCRDPGVGMAYTRAVFQALWLDALAIGLTDWVLHVDALVLRILRRMDDRLFRVIGSSCPAPVRPVRPVWARVGDARPSIFTNGLAPSVVILP